MGTKPGCFVVTLLAAAVGACSSTAQSPRDERRPVAAGPADAGPIVQAPPDASRPDAAVDAAVPIPDAAVDAQVFANPFVGRPCPAPKAIKRRKGKGDQSTELTDPLLPPRLELAYQVGAPELPRDDVFQVTEPEEEVFCGVVERIRGEAIHIAVDGTNGRETKTLELTLDSPLQRPFQVGSAVVVHAREVALMGGGVRLNVMITDDRGELLLAQIETGGNMYAPGFEFAAAPAGYYGRGTPTTTSTAPPPPAPREVYISRSGKRAVSKDTWRLLEVPDGRFAVWGLYEPVPPHRATYALRVRILRMPSKSSAP